MVLKSPFWNEEMCSEQLAHVTWLVNGAQGFQLELTVPKASVTSVCFPWFVLKQIFTLISAKWKT